jgi:hypothetical protein
VAFLITSGAGAAALIFVIYRMARPRPREGLELVPSPARSVV